MKALLCLAAGFAITATAAIRNDDGSMVLSAEEVANTIQYIRQIQASAIVNQQRIIELENELKLVKNSRCM